MHDLDRTLVALATPPGRGGLGCLRLSGPAAGVVAGALFRSATRGQSVAPGEAPRFGRFLGRDGRRIDHGYLVLFPAEAAYSGEPTAELWAHGSPAVLAELLEAALAAGAAPAGPGEFAYRALRHGRIDLARAEAVRDLVAARTLYQARVAFAQAEGALSAKLRPLGERLEEWIARGEAAVEFVDESETHLPAGALRLAVQAALDGCAELLAGFRAGRVIRDGAALAIVGRPNAGKSSLFNRLLERERAIVTEVAGTTRDTLEEALDLDGIPVRLVDTAGLREVVDPVEHEGVRRARAAREEADLVLLVLDGSRELEPDEIDALGRAATPIERDRTVVVCNKSDLPRRARLLEGAPPPLDVSALSGAGIGRLREELRGRLVGRGPLEDPLVTDARHAAALEAASVALRRARDAVEAGWSEEIVVEELREARGRLGEITGEFTTEDLYDRVFSTFCIGK